MGTQTVKMAQTNTTRVHRARASPRSSAVIMGTVFSVAGYVTVITTVGMAAMSETVARRRSAVPAGSGSALDTVCVLTSAGCATTRQTVPTAPMNPLSAVSHAICFTEIYSSMEDMHGTVQKFGVALLFKGFEISLTKAKFI